MKVVICRQSIGGYERVVLLRSCVIMSVRENITCEESQIQNYANNGIKLLIHTYLCEHLHIINF